MSAKDRLLDKLMAGYNPSVDPGKIQLTLGVSPIFVRYDHTAQQATLAVFEYHVSIIFGSSGSLTL